MPPFTFTGIRFLLGACLVGPLAWRDWRVIARRDVPPVSRDWLGILLLGLLLTLGAVFQQIGLMTTSVTHAGFLTGLYVPLVPLLSWGILRARPHWSAWPAALGCLIGTWMLSGAGQFELVSGDLWVIASSVFWALHVLVVGRVANRLDAPFFVACGQFLVCGLACLLWGSLMETQHPESLGRALWPILYAGLASVGIAYTAQVIGQRYTAAADAAIILSAETLFAALFGYLLMGDRPGPMALLGCALIFVCILAVQMLPLRRQSG